MKHAVISLAVVSFFLSDIHLTDTLPANTHFIGERYGGGVVFHVTEGGKHGLIVSVENVHIDAPFYNGVFREVGTENEKTMTDGKVNTELIIDKLGADNPKGIFAAKLCAEYVVKDSSGTYDDWYLPSKYELDLLFRKQNVLGNFDERYYWSSNEVSKDEGWIQSFYDGQQLNVSKEHALYVRAIRAF